MAIIPPQGFAPSQKKKVVSPLDWDKPNGQTRISGNRVICSNGEILKFDDRSSAYKAYLWAKKQNGGI